MSNIIGVKSRSRGRLIHCDAGELSLQVNDHVVVDTGQGLEVAKVVSLRVTPQPDEELAKVVRKAETKDLDEARRNLEREVLSRCREMVNQLGLKMKPLSARYDSEADRLTVFFSAEERVDFRDLVRKLSHSLERKVELRQVGARDEAKLLGGLGRCGYPLCCQNFLTSFTSVSIKMAKEQSLALNPMKISGVCGRLLCCLSYESKDYAAIKKKMPQPKQEISTSWGRAKVISVDLLKETVTIELLDSEAIKEVALSELIQPEKKPETEPDQTERKSKPR